MNTYISIGWTRVSSSESSGNSRTRSGSMGMSCTGGGGVLKNLILECLKWSILTIVNDHELIHLEENPHQESRSNLHHTIGMFFMIRPIIRWSFRCFRRCTTSMTSWRIFPMCWWKILIRKTSILFEGSSLIPNLFICKWWDHMADLEKKLSHQKSNKCLLNYFFANDWTVEYIFCCWSLFVIRLNHSKKKIF